MDWFLDKGVWILVTLVISAVAYLLLHIYSHRLVRRIVAAAEGVPLGDILASQANLMQGLLTGISGIFIIALGAVLMILAILGVNIEPALATLGFIGRSIGRWLAVHGIPILFIIGLSLAARELVRRATPRVIELFLVQRRSGERRSEAAKRAKTLSEVVAGTSTAVIAISVIFMVMSEVGVNIGPILAGLGILGLAVGFGGQYLVRDIISGLFIIGENQYRKGDVIRIAGIAGFVEDVSLRRTRLRDLDGIVHIIPNGEVTTSSNFTNEFSRVNMNIGVAYKEDMDHVFSVLNRIGEEMAQDPYFGPLIKEAPKVLRIDSFDDSAITIKVLGATQPLKQWEVAGELRLRIKKTFDEEGIEIPFPHRTVYWGVASDPFKTETIPPVTTNRRKTNRSRVKKEKLATPSTSEAARMPDSRDDE